MFFAANCKSCAWTWREGERWKVETEDDKLVIANKKKKQVHKQNKTHKFCEVKRF